MFYLTDEQVKKLDLVAVSGVIHSGKTTMTKRLVQHYGYTPYALARHFKVDCVAKDGMPAPEVFGTQKGEATRHALQQRGTEQGRNIFGESVWLQHAEAHIYDLMEHGVTKVVISDCRFENEVEWVQSLGGLVLRLYGRGRTGTVGHVSETALDDYRAFNGWLNNDPENEPHVFVDLDEHLAQTPRGPVALAGRE